MVPLLRCDLSPGRLGRRRGWDAHAEFLGVLTLHGREQVRRSPWCPVLLAFENLGIRFEILQQMGLHDVHFEFILPN